MQNRSNTTMYCKINLKDVHKTKENLQLRISLTNCQIHYYYCYYYCYFGPIKPWRALFHELERRVSHIVG